MKLTEKLLVPPGETVRLKDRDPDETAGLDKQEGEDKTNELLRRLDQLQYKLYAEDKRALLIVLQAMDAGGKDGTIRHVMSGSNPQTCKVTSFKAPSREEMGHDFLWRIHHAVPAHGEVGIFNRSHYEDVLVVRIHNLVPREVWSERYAQINAFERILVQNQVRILKFFLHISKDEQKKRLEARLKEPEKQWKIQPEDLTERKLWNQYTKAYEDALSHCSTEWAPWFIIPANHKWFRNYAVSRIIVETLEDMDPKFPKAESDISAVRFG